MFPVIQIGPLSIQAAGLFYLLGIRVGLSMAGRSARKFGLVSEQLDSLILIALTAGVLGARLVYAARYLEVFVSSPLSLLSLNQAMLDVQGGLIVGTLAALIYGQRKKMPLWPTLDALAPGFAVMQIAIGFSRLASGDGFGLPTDIPWAIPLWGEMRHPTQAYEILGGLAVLALTLVWLWKIPAEQKKQTLPGFLFFTFLAGSALMRILVDGFRGDSLLVFGGLRASQTAAWFLLAVSLWQIAMRWNPFGDAAASQPVE